MAAIIVIIIWLFLSHIVGMKASNKNKNYFFWFLLSIVTSPIVSFVLLLMFS